MTHGDPDAVQGLLRRFDDVGRAADSALDRDAAELARLLDERDALLDALTTALASPSSDAQAAIGALQHASASTAQLLEKVAERTHVLRQALREVERGTRATRAYQHPHGGTGFLDARR